MQAVVAQRQFTPDLSIAAMDFYRDLPYVDFSRQILQGAESVLRVLQVRIFGTHGSTTGPRCTIRRSRGSSVFRATTCARLRSKPSLIAVHSIASWVDYHVEVMSAA
jgi:hypothetical protein